MNSLQPNASRKDVLYLKRTPTVTYDYHSGNPIPDAIKKYYVQQQLPVRNQSLAANNISHRRDKRKLKSRHRCTSPPLARERSLNYNNNTMQKDILATVDKVTTTATATAATTTTTHASTLPRHFERKLGCLTYNLTQTIDKLDLGACNPPVVDIDGSNDEDEEFNFMNRPPSSLICIRPMNPSDNEDDNDSFLDEDVYDDDDMITAHSVFMDMDDDHSSDESSPPLTASPKPLGCKESLVDIPPLSATTASATTNYSPTHLFPLPPQQDMARRSTDTDFSDISDVILSSSATVDQPPSDNSHSTMTYSNLFLTTLHEEDNHAQRPDNPLHKSISSTSRSDTISIDTSLLSEVAREFRNRMNTTLKIKKQNSINDNHHAFTGKEAVDCLLSVLCMQDRAEAIKIGNSFIQQEFLISIGHDDENSREHNPFMIDSTTDGYTFNDSLTSSSSLSSASTASSEEDNLSIVVVDASITTDDMLSSSSHDIPTGVYTEFASCYSPTCRKSDTPCYSWTCQKKKHVKKVQAQVKEEVKRLWSESVPEVIFQSTPPEDRKRQECIYELIYTEQDFVRDLQYLQDFWVTPLLTKEIIDPARREQFVRDIFHNIADIQHVNTKLARALEARQAEQYVVSFIGDVMLQHVRNFEPFIDYGAHQTRGKYHYEVEKRKNLVFARFVEETERKPESRRLELNGYLTKPTTRLGRYNLLLREILKSTPEGNPDRTFIPQIMDIITAYLERVNVETGKSENLFDLQQLKERLEFKSPADYVDLELEQPQRQMLMKGRMKKKGGSSSNSAEMQVFLLDHYLVITKVKYENLFEKYKVYKKPIPLELLTVNASAHHVRPKRQSSVIPYSISNNIASLNGVSPKPLHSETFSSLSNKANQFPISFIHHGRKGSSSPITLYTSAISMQQNWLKKIKDQQQVLLSRKRAGFSMKPLMRKYFRATNRVNSTYALTDDSKNHLLIGADHGVYLLYYDSATESYGITRIIALERVTQVELIPDCSQLLVLADKTLWAFSTDVLSSTSIPQTRKGRAISQNTSFFHTGECIGKTLLCVVKSNALSATIIRVLEPVSMDESKRSKSLFKLKQRLVKSSGAAVGLKAYKDLYLPSEASSISLLKSKMCIASPMEIGVVDMKTFGVQALLDPEDEALGFVFNRQDVRPVTIYRIQFAEYLVCYNEFAFLVDQRGRFIRSSNRIDWEGTPDSFALSYPYIIAFERDFIEIRNVHTGDLAQIIRGQNIRCTSTNTHNSTIQVTMDDPENEGYQLIFQLEQDNPESPLYAQ